MVTFRDIADFTNGTPTGDSSVEIRSVHHVASESRPGGLFVAVRGARFDGHDFIPQALNAGVVGVVSELPRPSDFTGSWLQVPNIRLALAQAAAVVSGFPSRKLKLVGVTGTNGKTTTAYLLDSIFRATGTPSAMIGTVEYRCGDEVTTATRTTPEATDIQRLLERAVAVGCTHAVMEVSSIAIDLERASGLEFAAAVFSNLTQDHLDHHKTMEAYFDAKRRLFDGRLGPQPRVLALNLDDEHGLRLYGEVEGPARKLAYGIGRGNERRLDVWIEDFETRPDGLRLDVSTPDGRLELDSPLIGQPHVYNMLAATTAAVGLGIASDHIVRGMATVRVPGRFERVDDGSRGFTVVVDYAHTPDGVVNALRAARALTDRSGGRVVTVFGCGGDRDRSKRPLMAEAAALGSDVIVATSDNPRTESPEQILDDVEIGLRRVGKPYRRITDRREAIAEALRQARPGDLVVIAGKGHETYQILRDRTIHFDDRETARELLGLTPGKEAATHANP